MSFREEVLKENKSGRLYLELPLLVGGHVRTDVGSGVLTSNRGTIFFTPGIRGNLPIHSRVSLYGAAGAGLAGGHRNDVSASAGQVITFNRYTVGLAGSIGGGLDLRLSRLMSLRGEVRDFLSGTGFNGTTGHHYAIFGFGVGFHW